MPCSKSPYILLLVCFWLLQVLGPFVWNLWLFWNWWWDQTICDIIYYVIFAIGLLVNAFQSDCNLAQLDSVHLILPASLVRWITLRWYSLFHLYP
jgi:hypothetical protein